MSPLITVLEVLSLVTVSVAVFCEGVTERLELGLPGLAFDDESELDAATPVLTIMASRRIIVARRIRDVSLSRVASID